MTCRVKRAVLLAVLERCISLIGGRTTYPVLRYVRMGTSGTQHRLPGRILARDIADNLEAALEQFRGIVKDLEE
ncbi:MAG: hypothetical protein R6X13_04725 [bacterium]